MSFPGDIITPYDLARRLVGLTEIPGGAHRTMVVRMLQRVNPEWATDETAWCGAFAAFCSEMTGYESPGPRWVRALARNWLKVGQPIPKNEALPGDIVVLWRGNPSGWQGHVAYFAGWSHRTDGVILLGGNQSNRVGEATYDAARILGVRRLRPL